MSFQRILVAVFLSSIGVKCENSISVIEGQSVKLECSSSFPPPWTWTSLRDSHTKTLAISGTKPHPKLNEPRFEFFQEKSNYFLQISDVKFGDAGKFVCDGDAYEVTILNVLR